MRIFEEPFTTRDAILAILRPGKAATEGPFRTLRDHEWASAGLRVDVRTVLGQVLGRAHLYSSLNTDAARAVRLHREDLARRLAARAGELERSQHAKLVRSAVQAIASTINLDPLQETNISLQRYLRLRRQSASLVFDTGALARDWLVYSAAWLSRDERGELAEAVTVLARHASEARKDLIGDALPHMSTFFGIVRRMDAGAAEVEGPDGKLLIPRMDLERQGLAVLGQAVALLCEVLPAGGTLTLPMPAVAIETHREHVQSSPWDVDELDDGGTLATVFPVADQAWLDRALAGEPTAVPVTPIRRR